MGVSYVAVKKWAYSGKIKFIKTLVASIDIPKARLNGFLESRLLRVRSLFMLESALRIRGMIWKGRSRGL